MFFCCDDNDVRDERPVNGVLRLRESTSVAAAGSDNRTPSVRCRLDVGDDVTLSRRTIGELRDRRSSSRCPMEEFVQLDALT